MRVAPGILPRGLCLAADQGSGGPVGSGPDSYTAMERFETSAQALQDNVARFLDDFDGVVRSQGRRAEAFDKMRGQLETVVTGATEKSEGAWDAVVQAQDVLKGLRQSIIVFAGEESPLIETIDRAMGSLVLVDCFLAGLDYDVLEQAREALEEVDDLPDYIALAPVSRPVPPLPPEPESGETELLAPPEPESGEAPAPPEPESGEAAAPPAPTPPMSPVPTRSAPPVAKTLAAVKKLITWDKPKRGRKTALDKAASKRFNTVLELVCGMTLSFAGPKDQGVTNGHVRSVLGAVRLAFAAEYPELDSVVDSYARLLGADDIVYIISTAARRKNHPKDKDVKIMTVLLGIFKHPVFERAGWVEELRAAQSGAGVGGAADAVPFDELITWRDETSDMSVGKRFSRVMKATLNLNLRGTSVMNVGLTDQAVRVVLKRIVQVHGARYPELSTAIDAYTGMLGGDRDRFDVMSPTRCEQYGLDHPKSRKMNGLLDILRHPVFSEGKNIQALKLDS